MEGCYPINAAVFHAALHPVKFLYAVLQRALETNLLAGKLFHNFIPGLGKLRIHGPIALHHSGGHILHAVLRHAKLHGVADGPADQPAQNIALIDVGRGNPPGVAQNEGCTADMIRNDAERLDCIGAFFIFVAADGGDAGQNGRERIGIKHALSPLQRGNGAIQPHAGVHILLGQGLKAPFPQLVVFHEHIVPNFKVFSAGAGRIAMLAALGLARIIKDFRIRAAGACHAGRAPPVVLFFQIKDVAGVHAHLHPAVMGFGIPGRVVIPGKAGEIKLALIDAKPFFIGEELPAPGDGFLLEIIPQRPIAQHFKERAVGRIPHLVNIAGAHAFLHIRQALARGVLFAHEIGHKGMHARGSEQHRGVVFRNEGSGRNLRVAALLKEF